MSFRRAHAVPKILFRESALPPRESPLYFPTKSSLIYFANHRKLKLSSRMTTYFQFGFGFEADLSAPPVSPFCAQAREARISSRIETRQHWNFLTSEYSALNRVRLSGANSSRFGTSRAPYFAEELRMKRKKLGEILQDRGQISAARPSAVIQRAGRQNGSPGRTDPGARPGRQAFLSESPGRGFPSAVSGLLDDSMRRRSSSIHSQAHGGSVGHSSRPPGAIPVDRGDGGAAERSHD